MHIYYITISIMASQYQDLSRKQPEKKVLARGSFWGNAFKLHGLGTNKNETGMKGSQSKNALLSWCTAMDNQGLILLGYCKI